MAWIESHQALADHPKTRKLARLLGVSRVTAVGHLHFLWWWAMDYAQDGNVGKFDAIDVAIGADWEGDPDIFMDALRDAGFLDNGDIIHDWDSYAGRLIERRKADAERKRTARSADVQRTSAGHPEDGVRNTTVHNRTVHNRTNTPPLPPLASEGGDGVPKKSNTTKRTTIPADWCLTDELRAYAVEHGIPAHEVDDLAVSFHRYWQSDGRIKANWDTAFMSRVDDQAMRYQARAPNGTASPPLDPAWLKATKAEVHALSTGQKQDEPP